VPRTEAPLQAPWSAATRLCRQGSLVPLITRLVSPEGLGSRFSCLASAPPRRNISGQQVPRQSLLPWNPPGSGAPGRKPMCFLLNKYPVQRDKRAADQRQRVGLRRTTGWRATGRSVLAVDQEPPPGLWFFQTVLFCPQAWSQPTPPVTFSSAPPQGGAFPAAGACPSAPRLAVNAAALAPAVSAQGQAAVGDRL